MMADVADQEIRHSQIDDKTQPEESSSYREAQNQAMAEYFQELTATSTVSLSTPGSRSNAQKEDKERDS